jgi:lipoyl synthase
MYSRNTILRKPPWLKIKLPKGGTYNEVNSIIQKYGLNTICSSGNCPNAAECWGNGTATFMILGAICTRSCKFCNVSTGRPLPPNPEEPERIAESVRLLGLKHCVITSVDRDDLPDSGAAFWAKTIRTIREKNPKTTIEVLIPDFNGNKDDIQTVIDASPDIIAHNIETVKRLTPIVRSKAKYDVSLSLIDHVSMSGIQSKSGIMVGLGETNHEVCETMDDLLSVGCKIITIGQYLQPTLGHIPVKAYIHPDQFKELKEIGLKKGFHFVESGPLIRSSYHAEMQVKRD